VYEYWSTFGLGLISFLLLGLAVAISFAKGKAVVVWAAGVVAALFATAAGFHATHTIINDIVGTVVGFSPWIDLVLGLGLIFGLFELFHKGLLPPQVAPGAATVALVGVAFLVPLAQVSHTAVPGQVGDQITSLTKDFGKPGLTWSQRWFGKPGNPPSYYLGRAA
jgi:hypothetical protein